MNLEQWPSSSLYKKTGCHFKRSGEIRQPCPFYTVSTWWKQNTWESDACLPAFELQNALAHCKPGQVMAAFWDINPLFPALGGVTEASQWGGGVQYCPLLQSVLKAGLLCGLLQTHWSVWTRRGEVRSGTESSYPHMSEKLWLEREELSLAECGSEVEPWPENTKTWTLLSGRQSWSAMEGAARWGR